MRKALPPMLLALCCAFSGCFSNAVVAVSKNYNAASVRRVALLAFTDYPGMQGSGEIAAGTFEKYLLDAGYGVVERRQVAQILKEQSLSVSGAIDQTELRSIGRLLGVDALAMGNITEFSDVSRQTVLVDVVQEQMDPIFGQVVTTSRRGNETVQTTQNVITGYNASRTSQVLPETQTLPARAGISARLVDAQTGEILWSASARGTGDSLSAASENSASALMKAVLKKLKEISK